MTAAAVLSAAAELWAGPDFCTSGGGTVVNCSGDQSNGLIVNRDFANTTNVLNVGNAAGSPLISDVGGINWQEGRTNTTVNAQTGSFLVTGTGVSHSRTLIGVGTTTLNLGGAGVLVDKSVPQTNVPNAIWAQRTGAAGASDTNNQPAGTGKPGGTAGSTVLQFSTATEDIPFVVRRETGAATAAPTIVLTHTGGQGGAGGRPGGKKHPTGGGGAGGVGGTISVLTTNTDVAIDSVGIGLYAEALGGEGAVGAEGKGTVSGGNGGDGGPGGAINLQGDTAGAVNTGGSWDITTSGDGAAAVELLSMGHRGADGGAAKKNNSAFGGFAGDGGDGGSVSLYGAGSGGATPTSGWTINTSGDNAAGIIGKSIGADGGTGGAGSTLGNGGDGGNGGRGGLVVLGSVVDITTRGTSSGGLVGVGTGGNGGKNGDGGTKVNDNKTDAGTGGAIELYTPLGSSVKTFGDLSPGLSGTSLGGYGAQGASTTGLVTFAADGGNAGPGDFVALTNGGDVETTGFFSPGLLGMSVGGGGGNGGDTFGVFYGKGGGGSNGGAGGSVTIDNEGTVKTGGASSSAILAQSIGGTGGSGGSSGGLVALGGGATEGGSAGPVRVTHRGTIEAGNPEYANGSIEVETWQGPCPAGCSHGIVAQSIAGGGGNGGSSAGWFAIGGRGGKGDPAGRVDIRLGTPELASDITTYRDDSIGVIAQSIGGGGGNGGNATAFGGTTPLAAGVGGGGGQGGRGDAIQLLGSNSHIHTQGDRSHGISAQSLGGGGGNGGYGIAVTASVGAAISTAVGGGAGAGGSASTILSQTDTSTVKTEGDDSHAIVAQSIAGGGGNGGFAFAGSASIAVPEAGGIAVSTAVGGAGGAGGSASTVDAIFTKGDITTFGDRSSGVVAQSIGGGGGNGGTAIALSGTIGTGASTSAAISTSVGGAGSAGGTAQAVTANTSGTITTHGDLSNGIVAQAVGGGGGNGGTAISGNLTVSTAGDNTLGVSVGVGGTGGAGGKVLGDVQVGSSSFITTSGANSDAIVAQSISGGGGNGGSAMSGSAQINAGAGGKSLSVDVSVGGGAGAGDTAGDVNVDQFANGISTSGVLSDAIVAQSIGGGGGNGGMAAEGSFGFSTNPEAGNNAINVGIGGAGGGGGSAGVATVKAFAGQTISVTGDGAKGIIAQSIGGGGGNGGIAVSGTFERGDAAKALNVGVGGKGGKAGSADNVSVINDADLIVGTTQAYSPENLAAQQFGNAIVAQSIGGSGGLGGLSASAVKDTTANKSGNKGDRTISVDVGGVAGSGGVAGPVSVFISANTTTLGHQSDAIIAQSIGGGGGAGGGTMNYEEANKASKSLGVSVGGKGGESSPGGFSLVQLKEGGSVTASGAGSRGIIVQSIGGNGGAGGANHFTSKDNSAPGDALTVGVGGNASKGSAGGRADYHMETGASVSTGAGMAQAPEDGGQLSGHAVLVQSIGGSGGAGGAGMTGKVQTAGGDNSLDFNLGLGGKGAAGGSGGLVVVNDLNDATAPIEGTITTTNWNSHGLFAQSVGGGGGDGGVGINGNVVNKSDLGLNIGLGSKGGASGTGGEVRILTDAAITVEGDSSKAVFAQSIGGGGGNGGIGINGKVTAGGGEDTKQLTFGLGGKASGGGAGGKVSVANSGMISTARMAAETGREMDGIFAQSIGGGGGNGGIGVNSDGTAVEAGDEAGGIELNLGIGRAGSGGGAGGVVDVSNTGSIRFAGAGSRGIFAQSVGGGGGNGGAGIVGDLTTGDDKDGAEGTRYHLDIGIGAKGGQAAGGNMVSVENSGTILVDTRANAIASTTNAAGILAQSVGGGGGNAGIGIDGDMSGTSNTKAAQIGIGGGGAKNAGGGNGQEVHVTNINMIKVQGDGGRGIQAQSIGGGGGNGALGVSGSVATGSGDDGSDNSDGTAITFGLGQSGGNAGNGSRVTVKNSGEIATGTADTKGRDQSDAFAIHAQSLGGGGGTGILSGGLIFGTVNDDDTARGLDFAVGSQSSTGGSGGTVQVTNSGALSTQYDGSHALYAQSIGGGGGHAGSIGGIGTETGNLTWGATVAVGGLGSAGAGGEVDVYLTDKAATTETFGHGSHGIFAQSIGGGGGAAANAAGQSGSDATGKNHTTDNAKVAVNIGGKAGSTGNGGTVVVAATGSLVDGQPFTPGLGTVTTTGDAAIGILAQSVGGGGGTAGMGLQGAKGSVFTLGSTGNSLAKSTGNGGSVLVEYAGTVGTEGAGSHGIVLQSVGGGGGIGGTVDMKPAGNWGSRVAGGDSGTNGNGQLVRAVLSGATVTTGGDSAVGVFAQSVGGGGGVQGGAAAGQISQLGSTGGIGNGGTVSVQLSAGTMIGTSGAYAHGIFAQSAGGSGSTGSSGGAGILLDNTTVEATGLGAAGLIALTHGEMAGPVNINLRNGSSIKGGAGSQADTGGSNAAVWVLAGTQNNVLRTDPGTQIISANGEGGIAVKYSGSAGLTFYNGGQMHGTTDGPVTVIPTAAALSAEAPPLGQTHLINESTGEIYFSGVSSFDLLTNYGYIEILDDDPLAFANFTGDVINKKGSLLDIDFGPSGSALLGDAPVASDFFISSAGTIGFERGAKLALDVLGSFRLPLGTSFDLLAGTDLWFEGEDEADFSLTEYLVGDLLNGDWEFSLADAFSVPSPFAAAPAASGGQSGSNGFEVLRATYLGPVAPIPLPGGFLLYGTAMALGGAFLRRRARR